MRIASLFLTAGVLCSTGCVPAIVTASPTGTQNATEQKPLATFGSSTVKVGLIKGQRLNGDKLVSEDGWATIVAQFAGFPTEGRYGIVQKGEKLYIVGGWTEPVRYIAWQDETRFAESFDFRKDVASPKVYTFQLGSERGVYIDATDASLEGGLRRGTPVGSQDPSTRITFQLDFYGIRML